MNTLFSRQINSNAKGFAAVGQGAHLSHKKLALAVACAVLLSPANTNAAPAGGEVVGGSGSISQSGTQTTIEQTSDNLAIDWQSFDINADERVDFIQPDTRSVALNRVLSNNGSQILGQLNANGQVILVNPNGVFFGENATVDVGGLVASGLMIDPADFMNGDLAFSALEGTDGAVVNSGIIQAATGGNVALLGRQVENDGLISANLGSVALAAGKAAVLTFDASGLLGVRVTEAVLQQELGVDPAVLNSGDIDAAGGRVLLSASVSQDVFSSAVNHEGMAGSGVIVHDDGSFTLGAGADVVNTGAIAANSEAASGAAGGIVALGRNVSHSGSATAAGQGRSGGAIALVASDSLVVDNAGQLDVSGTNAGQVLVKGTRTRYEGETLATAAGSAGAVRIEGGQSLQYAGSVNGSNSGGSDGSLTLASDAMRLDSASAAAVSEALGSNHVTLQAEQALRLGTSRNGISIKDDGGNNLTLRAGTDIELRNSEIVLGSGDLNLTAGALDLCGDCGYLTLLRGRGIELRDSALASDGDIRLNAYRSITLRDSAIGQDLAGNTRTAASITAHAQETLFWDLTHSLDASGDIQLLLNTPADGLEPVRDAVGGYFNILSVEAAGREDTLAVNTGGNFIARADSFRPQGLSVAVLDELVITQTGTSAETDAANVSIRADILDVLPQLLSAGRAVNVDLAADRSTLAHAHSVNTHGGDYQASAAGDIRFAEGATLTTLTDSGAGGKATLSAGRDIRMDLWNNALAGLEITSARNAALGVFGAFDIAGIKTQNLTLRMTDTVTQSGAIKVSGDTRFDLMVQANAELSHADNDFNRLSIGTDYVGNAAITDANDVLLNGLELHDGNVSITSLSADGSITQREGTAIGLYDTWLALSAANLSLGSGGSAPVTMVNSYLKGDFTQSLALDGPMDMGAFDRVEFNGTDMANAVELGQYLELIQADPEFSTAAIYLGGGDDLVRALADSPFEIYTGAGNDWIQLDTETRRVEVMDFDEDADRLEVVP